MNRRIEVEPVWRFLAPNSGSLALFFAVAEAQVATPRR